jgi:hypothetical protein
MGAIYCGRREGESGAIAASRFSNPPRNCVSDRETDKRRAGGPDDDHSLDVRPDIRDHWRNFTTQARIDLLPAPVKIRKVRLV